jgi:hypothetical protein
LAKRHLSREIEVDGVWSTIGLGATMHADVDLPCIAVYCSADDLLPQKPANWRRELKSPDELQSVIDVALLRFADFHNLQGAFARRVVIEQPRGS